MIDLSNARRVYPSDSFASTFWNYDVWGKWHTNRRRAAMVEQVAPEGQAAPSPDAFVYRVHVIDSIEIDERGVKRQTAPRVLETIDKHGGSDWEAWRVLADFLGFASGFEDSRRGREISYRACLADAHNAAISVELLAELVADLAGRLGVEVEWFQFKHRGYRPGLRSVCSVGAFDVAQLDAHVRARDVYGGKGES